MGRVVGVTLVALGIYVGVWIARHGRQFRMQSRWMLVISAVRRIHRRVRERSHRNGNGLLTHEHPHVTATTFHHELGSESPLLGTRSHTHRHHHDSNELSAGYGTGAALTIGVLHGVGAETPTQVLIFLAAAGARGAGAGVALLTVFLVGLFTANSAVTLASAFGFLSATRYPRIYLGFGVLTVLVSLGVGLLFLAGREAVLPILVGG